MTLKPNIGPSDKSRAQAVEILNTLPAGNPLAGRNDTAASVTAAYHPSLRGRDTSSSAAKPRAPEAISRSQIASSPPPAAPRKDEGSVVS